MNQKMILLDPTHCLVLHRWFLVTPDGPCVAFVTFSDRFGEDLLLLFTGAIGRGKRYSPMPLAMASVEHQSKTRGISDGSSMICVDSW